MGTPTEIAAAAPAYRAAAAAARGRVDISEHYVSIDLGEGADLEEAFRRVRALGWRGEGKVMLREHGKERGETMELLSTATGRGTPQYPVRSDWDRRVAAAWDATATS